MKEDIALKMLPDDRGVIKKDGKTYVDMRLVKSWEYHKELPEEPADWKTEYHRLRLFLDRIKWDYFYISRLLAKPRIMDDMIRSRKTFAEFINQDMYEEKKKANPHFERTVLSISHALDHVLHSPLTRNPDIGKNIKKKADAFAKSMGDALSRVREEGHTTMRAIAARFNELGIKSARGSQWTHTTVNQLVKRRRKLGLE